jgi:hypothetical protein
MTGLEALGAALGGEDGHGLQTNATLLELLLCGNILGSEVTQLPEAPGRGAGVFQGRHLEEDPGAAARMVLEASAGRALAHPLAARGVATLCRPLTPTVVSGARGPFPHPILPQPWSRAGCGGVGGLPGGARRGGGRAQRAAGFNPPLQLNSRTHVPEGLNA